MTFTERTVECPLCGNHYKIYVYRQEDLYSCPKCRRVPEVQPTRPQVVEEISK